MCNDRNSGRNYGCPSKDAGVHCNVNCKCGEKKIRTVVDWCKSGEASISVKISFTTGTSNHTVDPRV